MDQKQKSYATLKSENIKFSKIVFTPPIENEGGEFDIYCLAWRGHDKGKEKGKYKCERERNVLTDSSST